MTCLPEESRTIYCSKDNRQEKTFEALDWLAAMTSHLPNQGQQMVRYYEHEQREQFPQLPAGGSERISSHPETPFPVDRRMAIFAKGRLCRPVDRRMAIFAKGRLSASGRSAVPIFWRDSLPGVGQDAFS
jgi:hypothetical protein